MADLNDEPIESGETETGLPDEQASTAEAPAESNAGGFFETAEMMEAFEAVESFEAAEGSANAAESAEYAGLTEEQVALEREFLKGIPRLNIGALFLPPIWGPAHGIWATILYYPIWLFADNAFYAAYSERSVLSIVVAVVIFITLTVATVVFALLAQPFAAHRAAQKGVKKEDYVRRERIWAIVCVIVGLVMIALAAYYNIVIRPTLGEM